MPDAERPLPLRAAAGPGGVRVLAAQPQPSPWELSPAPRGLPIGTGAPEEGLRGLESGAAGEG